MYGLVRICGPFRLCVKQPHFYAAGISNMEDKECGRPKPDNDDHRIFKYRYLVGVWGRQGVIAGDYLQRNYLFPIAAVNLF